MRGYNCHEEIEVYRTADRLCFKAGGNWCACPGSVPEDGHLGGDVLQVEEKVRRLGNSRTPATAFARRRERTASLKGAFLIYRMFFSQSRLKQQKHRLLSELCV